MYKLTKHLSRVPRPISLITLIFKALWKPFALYKHQMHMKLLKCRLPITHFMSATVMKNELH